MFTPKAVYVPDLRFETALAADGVGPICGVDEAGRGPLAGPVVAAAVILAPFSVQGGPNKKGLSGAEHGRIPDGLNDSKALSHSAREYLLNAILQNCYVGIGIAEPEEICRLNILGASLAAMARAVSALPISPAHALIDGNRAAPLSCAQTTIIKGDAKSLSISAASIVAKVTRDRLMMRADARFAGYNFSRHKGYPTAAHRQAIERLGPCPIHRRSFAPIKKLL